MDKGPDYTIRRNGTNNNELETCCTTANGHRGRRLPQNHLPPDLCVLPCVLWLFEDRLFSITHTHTRIQFQGETSLCFASQLFALNIV